MTYQLYYWTGLQGRGEFVRLALEHAGAPYRDVAREEGDEAITRFLEASPTPAFAPPFLVDGDIVVGQVAAILLHLSEPLGLAPQSEAQRLWAHQIQLTVTDFVAESHDVHHPVGIGAYFEDQREEARRRAAEFRAARVPKFLDWFETILARNPAGSTALVGERWTSADLSLFQVMAGLRYAFPDLMADLEPSRRLVRDLVTRVATSPAIASYLASPRRLAFSETDLFRHYPELDP